MKKGTKLFSLIPATSCLSAERQELEPFIKWIEIVVCKCNAKALQMLDYIRFMK